MKSSEAFLNHQTCLLRKRTATPTRKNIALKRAAAGYWCPISGKIEEGESQQQAVVREVFEEVDLVVEPIRKLFEFDTRDRSALIHWWHVRIVSGVAKLKNQEHTELKWVTLDEARALTPIFEEDLNAYIMIAAL